MINKNLSQSIHEVYYYDTCSQKEYITKSFLLRSHGGDTSDTLSWFQNKWQNFKY